MKGAFSFYKRKPSGKENFPGLEKTDLSFRLTDSKNPKKKEAI